MAIRRLFYLVLVASAAFAVYFYIPQSQNMWVIWVALPLALITSGNTFLHRISTVLATGVVSAIIILLTGLAAANMLVLGLWLGFLTGGLILFAQAFPEEQLSFFLINFFAIVAAMLPGWDLVPARLVFALKGTLIATLLQIIFWPYFVRYELRNNLPIVIKTLKHLANNVFSCFLRPEYPENIYLFEKRLHIQKNAYFHAIFQMREITAALSGKNHNDNKLKAKKAVIDQFIQQAELTFDAILACAQLRLRVSDQTVFSVCQNEMIAIEEEIDQIFSEMSHVLGRKKYHLDVAGLLEKISALEDNYHHVLKVTAREPLVFLLFIASAKNLCTTIAKLYEAGVNVKDIVRN